jgi:uncharacterized membrane protein required for colicin V production
MSYLRYLCFIAYSGVHHKLCCVVFSVFVFVPNIPSFSGLSILDCPFGFTLTFIKYE